MPKAAADEISRDLVESKPFFSKRFRMIEKHPRYGVQISTLSKELRHPALLEISFAVSQRHRKKPKTLIRRCSRVSPARTPSLPL
jgi:hypothetical protein